MSPNLPPLWAEWYPSVPPFVDWMTLTWSQPGLPDYTGEIWQRIDPETGEVKFERKLNRKLVSWSGSARASIDISIRDGRVRIDGNPMKFDNGFNHFYGPVGPWVVRHPRDVAQSFIRAVGNHPDVGLPLACEHPHITRIDLTKHLPVPRNSESMKNDQADLLRWLGLVSSHRGKAATASSGGEMLSTVYLKASSRLWSLKAYSKGDEVRDQLDPSNTYEIGEDADGKPLLDGPTYADLDDPWLWGTARVELTLRSQEMSKLGEVLGFDSSDPERPRSIFELSHDVLDDLWRIYWRRIRMPNSQPIERDQMMEVLPRRLRSVYARWKMGEDFTRSMTRTTLWRYRKDLMAYGVNIDLPSVIEQPGQGTSYAGWAQSVGALPGGASAFGDPAQLKLFEG